jgi:hypothetical protein
VHYTDSVVPINTSPLPRTKIVLLNHLQGPPLYQRNSCRAAPLHAGWRCTPAGAQIANAATVTGDG